MNWSECLKQIRRIPLLKIKRVKREIIERRSQEREGMIQTRRNWTIAKLISKRTVFFLVQLAEHQRARVDPEFFGQRLDFARTQDAARLPRAQQRRVVFFFAWRRRLLESKWLCLIFASVIYRVHLLRLIDLNFVERFEFWSSILPLANQWKVDF